MLQKSPACVLSCYLIQTKRHKFLYSGPQMSATVPALQVHSNLLRTLKEVFSAFILGGSLSYLGAETDLTWVRA